MKVTVTIDVVHDDSEKGAPVEEVRNALMEEIENLEFDVDRDDGESVTYTVNSVAAGK